MKGSESLRKQKKRLKKALGERDFGALDSWFDEGKNPTRILFNALFDADEIVRWRAVEFIAEAQKRIAKEDLSKPRDVIRRLFWQMNDESGGLIWNAPETICLILLKIPKLIPEYFNMLASFLREEPFERGTHWALAQLLRVYRKDVDYLIPILAESLKDPDPGTRRAALDALSLLEGKRINSRLPELLKDTEEVKDYNYDTGQFIQHSVSQLASQLNN